MVSIVGRVVPSARVVSVPTREFFSCTIVVDTDDEKRRINGDAALLEEMARAGALAGHRPPNRRVSRVGRPTLERGLELRLALISVVH
jgi:hypothetical protein